MHPTRSSIFDSFLHPSKGTSSPQPHSDPLIDQILELEKKKLLLQKNNGSVSGDQLKRKIQELVEEVEHLQQPQSISNSIVSHKTPPPATPAAAYTPPFMRTVSSMKSPLENPLTSSKQAAIQALLADLEHDAFSDDVDDIEEDDSSFTSPDRRASRDTARGNSARLSLTRTELSEAFSPQNNHHPLSNRLNYQAISSQTVTGNRPISTTFTPPRYSLNNRTISIASEAGGRESLGSTGVMERVTSLGHQSSIDEAISRQHPETIDFSNDLVQAIASKRASVGTDDLEGEFLEQSATLSQDMATSQSPPNQQLAANSHHNLLEFCMIEADWDELVKQSTAHLHQETMIPDPSQPHLLSKGKFLSNLVPSKLVWRYPANVDEHTNNTSTIQEQNFFFPSGVKVELVSKAVKEIKTRSYQQKRHIVPFSDRQGVPLYACCLTVHQVYGIEEVKRIHEEIPMYLYRILRGKQAAITIQKAFRLYQKQKRIKQWQSIDIADIKRLQQERQFFAHHGGGSTASDTTGTTSQAGNSRFSFHGNNSTPHSNHHRGSGTNPSTQASGGGFFSRLFTRRGGDSGLPDQSAHQTLEHSHHGFFGSSRHDRSYTVSSHGKPDGSTTSTPTKHHSLTQMPTVSTSTTTPTAPAPQRSSSLSFFGRASLGTASKTRGASLDKTKSESSIDYGVSPPQSSPIVSHRPNESTDLHTPDELNHEVSTIGTPEKLVNDHPNHVQEAIVPVVVPSEAVIEEEQHTDSSHHEEAFDFESFIQDKVVIGQKAYCIISSSPEYTFIFLILDAIHEAETEFYKERMARMKEEKETNDLEGRDIYSGLGLSLVEHELLRAKFLSKVKLFMEHYLLNKQFQLEDLSNRFIVPSNYFQYKLNSFPSFQSIEHRQRYDFYYQLMFPNRSLPTNQQEFEEELKKNDLNEEVYPNYLFDSPRFSPKPSFRDGENTNSPAGSSIVRIQKTFSRSFSNQSIPNYSNRNSRRLETKNHRDGSDDLGKIEGEIKDLSLVDPKEVGEGDDAVSNPTTTQESAFSPEKNSHRNLKKNNNKKKDLTVVTSPTAAAATTSNTSGPSSSTYSQQLRVRGYGKALKIDFRYLLSTKEWSCAVLFTHLNTQVIFKIMNLLLMEKSLIIYGKNPGIVSAITLGVINLISPFLWEGIFIPLVPDIARELFGAPVPLVIGTISPPRMADVSAGTAILHLNDDTVQAKLLFTLTPNISTTMKSSTTPPNTSETPNRSQEDKEGEEVGGGGDASSTIKAGNSQTSAYSSIYGVKMPALPKKKRKQSFLSTAATTGMTHQNSNSSSLLHNSHTALSAAVASAAADIFEDHTITVHVQEIDFLAWFTRLPDVTADMPLQEEICRRITYLRKLICHYLLPKLHYVYDICLYDPRQILEELESKQQLTTVLEQIHANRQVNNSSNHTSIRSPIYLKTMEKAMKIANTVDHLLLSQRLPSTILQQMMIVLTRMKQYNYHFCGEILSHTYDWNRFLKRNEKTQMEEFYPHLFLEIIRNKLEFQDAMVHTQMFISFLDRIRKETMLLNQIRRYIGQWIYHHFKRRKAFQQQQRLLQSQQQQQIPPPVVGKY